MKTIILPIIISFIVTSLYADTKAVKISNTDTTVKKQNLLAQNSRRSRRLRRQYKKYESKAELARAISLARQKKYEEASVLLYSLSRNPKYRAEREQIRYILGIMLFQMNLYQTAGYQFVSVIRDGKNKYVDKALEKLSIAADYLNDRTLLNYSMSKIRLEKFPKSARDMLRFRVGEYQYNKKLLDKAAHNFSRVPSSSPYFSKAKYMQGLANAQQNQLRDAMNAFRQVVNAREDNGPVDTNLVAAQMGIARIYYQNRSWEKAVAAYREIPRDSPFWHEALFEMSWSLMRSAKLRSVLSNFHSLHSPYYEDAYLPESLLLRSIVYLYICQYDEMDKTLKLYERIYKPVSNKLKRYLASRPRASDYYVDYLKVIENHEELMENKSDRKSYKIPFILVNYLSNQGDVEATQFYINKLLQEEKRIAQLPAEWKNSRVGKASIRLVERRLASARRKLGLIIKRHLIYKNRELDKLTEQHDFARFEMLNAKKEGIKKSIGTVKQKQLDDAVDREFYVQNGFEYWPFQGEYWLDELGNYHYLGTKTCE